MIEDHSKEVPIPLISSDLLKALDSRFPASPPSLDDRTREVWFKAGQRYMVEWLYSIYRQQQDEDVLRP